jgi:hypothetical protein
MLVKTAVIARAIKLLIMMIKVYTVIIMTNNMLKYIDHRIIDQMDLCFCMRKRHHPRYYLNGNRSSYNSLLCFSKKGPLTNKINIRMIQFLLVELVVVADGQKANQVGVHRYSRLNQIHSNLKLLSHLFVLNLLTLLLCMEGDLSPLVRIVEIFIFLSLHLLLLLYLICLHIRL